MKLNKNQLAITNGKTTHKLAWLRCRKAKAIPLYARYPKEKRLILKKYIEAQILNLSQGKKFQVDHIIPLNHPYVCGLHVSSNLQILSKLKNCNKSNTFTPHIEKNGKKYYYNELKLPPFNVIMTAVNKKLPRNYNPTKKSPPKIAKRRSKTAIKRLKTVKNKLKTTKNSKLKVLTFIQN